MKKHKAEKQLKDHSYLAAMASDLRDAMYSKAKTEAVYFHKCRRTRDGDNHLAMLKYAFDGFAMAGVIQNDSGFRHEPVRFEIDKEYPRVEITITQIEGNQ